MLRISRAVSGEKSLWSGLPSLPMIAASVVGTCVCCMFVSPYYGFVNYFTTSLPILPSCLTELCMLVNFPGGTERVKLTHLGAI